MFYKLKNFLLIQTTIFLFLLIFTSDQTYANVILSEDFEDGVLDSRISVETLNYIDISPPGIKNITNFGSTKAFGFGRASCYNACWAFNYTTIFKITFPNPTYVSSISFKEIELYSNGGSMGVIYIDGQRLSATQDFGRLPYNDGIPDSTFRVAFFPVNKTVSVIELRVLDVAANSEIFIDDLVINGQTTCLPPPSGLVSWWKGENNANDRIGSNHGTMINGATFAPGIVGQAFSFDGVDDYMEAPDNGLPFGSNERTIVAWVYPTQYRYGLNHIFHYGFFSSGQSFGLVLRKLNDYYSNLIAHEWLNYDGAGIVQLNQWNHVAITLKNGLKRHYINGVLVGESTYNPNTVSSGYIKIGARIYDIFSPPELFTGLIDEVAVFNRALTDSEIAAIYNAGSSGMCDTILTVTKSGTVSGTVTSSPAGINCGTDCSEFYQRGTTVTLTATPSNIYTTTKWGGDCSFCNNSNTCQLTMNSDKACTVNFLFVPPSPSYLLNVIKEGDGAGRVISVPSGIDCGSKCNGYYEVGTKVKLTALAEEGSLFKGWGLHCSHCGMEQECNVDMDSVKTCKANFSKEACNHFTDVPCSHWAAEAINEIYKRGITMGYPDGTFRPDSQLTREEIVAFVVRAKYGEEFEYETTPYFSDVSEGDWSWKYIQKAKQEGIIKGCEQDDPNTEQNENRFCIDEYVNREQMAVIIGRAKGLEPARECRGDVFGDVNVFTTTEEFCRYIEKIKEEGITRGCLEDPPMYCPKKEVTRAEMAVILWRAFLGGR